MKLILQIVLYIENVRHYSFRLSDLKLQFKFANIFANILHRNTLYKKFLVTQQTIK